MKLALFLCAIAAPAFASQPILVRVTPETLAKLQEKDPMVTLVKPKESVEIERPTATSPLLESCILHDGKNWTMVPSAAVVHLPAKHEAKVNSKPIGTLLPWKEFLQHNRSWIQVADVSFEQAAGTEEIPNSTASKWKDSGKVVVACHQLGPISVSIAAPEMASAR